MNPIMRMTLVLLVAVLTVTTMAQDKAAIKYSPESTSVAIVPVVNASGEKDKNFRTGQIDAGTKYLTKTFSDRGFKLVEPDSITRAVSDLKIDLADEESYNKATLYKIGKGVKADLVVFAVITQVSQHMDTKFFVVTREGRATVKMWLLDVKNEVPHLSAVSKLGKSGGPGFAEFKKGSDEILHAVANGERDLLKDFLKPYALIKKEKQ